MAAKRRKKIKEWAKKVGLGGWMRKAHNWTAYLGMPINRLFREGPSQQAFEEIVARYSGIQMGLVAGRPGFDVNRMLPHAEGLITHGLTEALRTKITGHYRKVGQKRLLPITAEIIRAVDALWCGSEGSPVGAQGAWLPPNIDFVASLDCYQDGLMGYSPDADTFDISRRYTKLMGVEIAADAVSWAMSRFGLNRHLPKGINA